jgi:integrase
MPLRPMKQKKYKGIYEYYKTSDVDKATTAFYISVRDDEGKPKKIKTEASTANEAVVALAQYKSQRVNRTLSTIMKTQVTSKTTLDELADMFFNQRSTANNPKDKRKYELHISPILGSMNIHKVQKNHLQKLQDELEVKQIQVAANSEIMVTPSAKTVNTIIDLTYFILNWAYNENHIKLPVPKLKKIKLDNARDRILSDDEMQLLFDSIDADALMLVKLMYYTGVRPESALRLKVSDIANNHIHISSIKKQEAHKIPISSKLKSALEPFIFGLDKDDYIISQSSKEPSYGTLHRRLGRVFLKLFNEGLDHKADMKQWVSLYTLRHTSLTNIYKHTKDVFLTQKIANHSDIRMTQRYAKVNDEQKIDAMEGL